MSCCVYILPFFVVVVVVSLCSLSLHTGAASFCGPREVCINRTKKWINVEFARVIFYPIHNTLARTLQDTDDDDVCVCLCGQRIYYVWEFTWASVLGTALIVCSMTIGNSWVNMLKLFFCIYVCSCRCVFECNYLKRIFCSYENYFALFLLFYVSVLQIVIQNNISLALLIRCKKKFSDCKTVNKFIYEHKSHYV